MTVQHRPDALCILSVHAHPDDEASKAASTIARYHAEDVRTVLVCCTGGEAGEILNPEADTPAAREDLPAVRRAELDESVRIIGYDRLYLLGYRDSGMPGTDANADPRNFANADFDEAVGRLVAIIRAERPQVVLTYGRDGRYEHPDHYQVHDISMAAFDRAGDPGWYPDEGAAWQPLKLYFMGGLSPARVFVLHDWFVDHGEESPFAPWIDDLDRDADDPTTTRIDVRDYLEVGRAALLAHRTQVGPDGFWFRMPIEVAREQFPWEDFVLARSLVDVSGERYEDDLFAGVREPEPVEGQPLP